MSKAEQIQRERVRLAALFVELPREKFYSLLGLIDRAAFLRVTLEEMQADFKATDIYKNGQNQEGEKISATLQAYNQTTKVYQKLMAQLMDYIPHEQRQKFRPMHWDENEFLAFKNFQERQDLDFFLSDDFKNTLEKDRAKALELMLEGN